MNFPLYQNGRLENLSAENNMLLAQSAKKDENYIPTLKKIPSFISAILYGYIVYIYLFSSKIKQIVK